MGVGNKELLILGLMCMLGNCFSKCGKGFITNEGRDCVDVDECNEDPEQCGKGAKCYNTNGTYYCVCLPGFRNIAGTINFTVTTGQCRDINECTAEGGRCGRAGHCSNLIGSYNCTCQSGYFSPNGTEKCREINRCEESKINICGENGTCQNDELSYWCKCQQGYSNYGNKRTPCSELKCDGFSADSGPTQSPRGLANILSMMRNSCLALSSPSAAGGEKFDGETLLEKLFTATEAVLSPGRPDTAEDVSLLLGTVENSIMFIGPQLKGNHTKIQTNETDAQIAVRRGSTRPTGAIHLTNENATLETDWETASGTGTYPGFAMAALLTYKNLKISGNRSFEELKGREKDGVDPSFQIFSRVVSVVVSNPSTQNLSRSVNITLRHLKDAEESPEERYICAYWTERETWSTDGCYQHHSNATHTVCTCEHLSSFAVLMALYPIEEPFGLLLVNNIALIISIVCLLLSILTFMFCRSIKGTRTTIHLHLCICLFLADLIFLAGISQTEPVNGCRFVAAMLHYLFLGVFTWMLLEGVQLYRMVVLVFNATIRPLYLFLAGYGMPLLIVIISAIIRPKGYGTDKFCWLSLEDGLIWSFVGPVCFIIVINVFFFIITVWKLAHKFTSLNPELSKLNKIKAFTVTAIAQMCILGLMWVFGTLLFQEGTVHTRTVSAYIFTILNSLQGALIFILHCLLSKQVREEYAHFLSCICTTHKKRYSDLTSTNPSSTQSQGSRSGQQTSESQI
ncbi:adhesion G protein-coupled receptor E5 isoform X1 [Limanda limanda]|uniref:adhesion G protein-coupled receptor E5 isoform X1 n=2 Tax=Limanda limanda TaxID=27771 RepID=UPI0029C7EC2C|nr:adhesion G protein-coupled receptor E5 isoform X1 [Limanda limanda]